MVEIAREFLARLSTEEEHFVGQTKLDDIGIGLVTALKEFDHYYYHLVRNDYSEEATHHFHIMQFGLPRLISAVLSTVPCFRYPVVTFRSDSRLISGTLDMVAAFGVIEQGRRFAQAALAGECEVIRFSERQYDVVLPDVVFNMEQHEASVENHYVRFERHRMEDALEKSFGKTGTKAHLDVLLKENVYVFREHFIGYDAHPDLDDYFFGLALWELTNQSGYDTYNRRVEFGGITVEKYTLATAFFLSLALKHEGFSAALFEKSPQIRLRDVLTITQDKGDLETSLIEALNWYGPSFDGYTPISRDEAKTILKVLSVRRNNISILSSTLAPLPFLIEYSDSAWITSVAAVQTGAIAFLLNSLRFNFPADYDRNQRAREGSMQRALRRLLSEYLPGLKFVENVKIRKDGKTVTDIDFVAIDETGGSAIFFQLKHQDHYGGDMKRRSNRADRLRKEVDHWLASIRQWLADVDRTKFCSALQVRNNSQIGHTFLVIVARHFAHFLSTSDLRDDAAYATWTQVFDALNRLYTEDRPRTLVELFETLRQYMTHKMARGFELEQLNSYHLPRLSYRIRPASAREGAKALP